MTRMQNVCGKIEEFRVRLDVHHGLALSHYRLSLVMVVIVKIKVKQKQLFKVLEEVVVKIDGAGYLMKIGNDVMRKKNSIKYLELMVKNNSSFGMTSKLRLSVDE